MPRALAHRHHRFSLASLPSPAGRYPFDLAARAALLESYDTRARFGDQPTPDDSFWWHGHRQTIYVLERRGASAGAGQALTPAPRPRRS